MRLSCCNLIDRHCCYKDLPWKAIMQICQNKRFTELEWRCLFVSKRRWKRKRSAKWTFPSHFLPCWMSAQNRWKGPNTNSITPRKQKCWNVERRTLWQMPELCQVLKQVNCALQIGCQKRKPWCLQHRDVVLGFCSEKGKTVRQDQRKSRESPFHPLLEREHSLLKLTMCRWTKQKSQPISSKWGLPFLYSQNV